MSIRKWNKAIIIMRPLKSSTGNSSSNISDIDKFEIITKIGKGKYSEVYTGISTVDDKNTVIKALKPVKKSKMKR